MKSEPIRKRSANPPPGPRLNLNGAAERVAAAYGFKIKYRETLEPTNGRVEVMWLVMGEGSPDVWSLDLFCQPAIHMQGGWAGWVRITRYGDDDLLHRILVLSDEGFSGRRACQLTRERFCAWAATLEPGSRVTGPTNEAKLEPMEVV